MGKTVGFGVVGTGVIFRDHAAALRHLGGAARLVGVAELDEGRRTDATSMAYAPVACKDYHDLLKRDDIDVISVCTPPAYHGQVVIDALDAGKYVVCEKPLAQTLDAADRIIEHAKKYPGKLSTVFQLRYEPEMRRIKWLLDSGHLGKLVYAHCSRRANLVGTGGEKGGWWGNWTTAGGGVVMTQFIHHLDQLIYLFGDVAEVEATLATVKQPIESEDSFGATIRFQSGAIATCGATVAAQDFEYRLDIVGQEMSVHLPWSLRCADSGKLRQAQREVERQIPVSKMPRGSSVKDKIKRRLGLKFKLFRPPAPMHAGYLREVADAVRDNRPLPLGPDEGRKSLELTVAIYTAGITGQRVTLPLTESTPFYRGVTPENYQQRLLSGTLGKA